MASQTIINHNFRSLSKISVRVTMESTIVSAASSLSQRSFDPSSRITMWEGGTANFIEIILDCFVHCSPSDPMKNYRTDLCQSYVEVIRSVGVVLGCKIFQSAYK